MDGPIVSRELPRVLHQLTQGVYLGPAQRIALVFGGIVVDAVHVGMRDVFHEHGLKLCRRAAERCYGKVTLQAREQVEKTILAPENHRRLEYRPSEPRLGHDALSVALAAQILAGT